MSQVYNIIKKSKFKQIKFRDRVKIEILHKLGKKASMISAEIGFTKRSINRELARGMVYGLRNSDYSTRDEYSADKAQKDADNKASAKGKGLKIAKSFDLSNHLEKSIIEEKNSPYSALEKIKQSGQKFKVNICEKTLYNYIASGLFLKLNSSHLPYKKKDRKKKTFRIANNNRRGTSIEERPKEILKREEYGHWEMDCVVGKRKGKGPVLLVLTERKTRKELIFKMKSKTQDCVIKALDGLERLLGKEKFQTKFQTITTDNGVEFLDFEGIEKTRFKKGNRTKVYYAHAFCSAERGSNENANKLIRRWIPKGVDISEYSKKQIKEIEDWINNYPRRIFGGLTSNDLEKKEYSY